jgi:hypothetical protein
MQIKVQTFLKRQDTACEYCQTCNILACVFCTKFCDTGALEILDWWREWHFKPPGATKVFFIYPTLVISSIGPMNFTGIVS